jgi:hypothetical protein
MFLTAVAVALRAIVVPVEQWARHKQRAETRRLARMQAQQECRCGLCGVIDAIGDCDA